MFCQVKVYSLLQIKLLLDWKMPHTVLGMQQFLGLANYFRKFIQNYSRIAAPLYSLTKSTGAFQSGEETSKAFADIKRMLTSGPILRYPDPDKPYLVISDASVTGYGAILIQDGIMWLTILKSLVIQKESIPQENKNTMA
jgi:hypothetical protein